MKPIQFAFLVSNLVLLSACHHDKDDDFQICNDGLVGNITGGSGDSGTNGDVEIGIGVTPPDNDASQPPNTLPTACSCFNPELGKQGTEWVLDYQVRTDFTAPGDIMTDLNTVEPYLYGFRSLNDNLVQFDGINEVTQRKVFYRNPDDNGNLFENPHVTPDVEYYLYNDPNNSVTFLSHAYEAGGLYEVRYLPSGVKSTYFVQQGVPNQLATVTKRTFLDGNLEGEETLDITQTFVEFEEVAINDKTYQTCKFETLTRFNSDGSNSETKYTSYINVGSGLTVKSLSEEYNDDGSVYRSMREVIQASIDGRAL